MNFKGKTHSEKSNFSFHFIGVDIRCDGGLTLALALWSRSAVLLDLNRGSDALVDIQSAIDNGLDDVKKQLEYYVRLAKANASKYTTEILCVTTLSIYIHFLCDLNGI